jgi:hypothetical protein
LGRHRHTDEIAEALQMLKDLDVPAARIPAALDA